MMTRDEDLTLYHEVLLESISHSIFKSSNFCILLFLYLSLFHHFSPFFHFPISLLLLPRRIRENLNQKMQRVRRAPKNRRLQIQHLATIRPRNPVLRKSARIRKLSRKLRARYFKTEHFTILQASLSNPAKL